VQLTSDPARHGGRAAAASVEFFGQKLLPPMALDAGH
jgi:hypothetical protein